MLFRSGRVRGISELDGAVLTVTGHDHPCAAAGAGATAIGDALDSCGTAEAILRSAPAPVPAGTMEDAAARGVTVGCHVLPRRQVLLGFFKAGIALKRFLWLLGAEDVGERRSRLDEGALSAVAGAGGLVVSGMAEDADRKSTRLNSSHIQKSRMPSSA